MAFVIGVFDFVGDRVTRGSVGCHHPFIALADASIALADASIALADAPIALADAPIALADAPIALADASIALADAPIALVGACVALAGACVALVGCVPSPGSSLDAGTVVFDSALDSPSVEASIADAEAPRVEVLSVAGDGTIGNGESLFATISRDQRFVAFGSEATNLVAGDRNGVRDIFLRDRNLKTTERISLGPLGAEGDGLSNDPSISDDGRFVVFASKASNFAIVDTNQTWDVFLLDRQGNGLTCLSCDALGRAADKQSLQARISGDGRFVVFQSDAALTPGDANPNGDIYLYAREEKLLSLVTQAANGKSWYPSISRNGDLIAFDSFASNLVPGDTNGERDVFTFRRSTMAMARVSVASNGAQGQHMSTTPALAADAEVVAFSSWSYEFATPSVYNLDAYARDFSAGTTSRMSQSASGNQGDRESWFPAISADGRFVAFDSTAENLTSGSTGGLLHVYVRDRTSNAITRVASSGDKFFVSFVKFTDDATAIVFGTSDSTFAPGGNRQIVWMRR